MATGDQRGERVYACTWLVSSNTLRRAARAVHVDGEACRVACELWQPLQPRSPTLTRVISRLHCICQLALVWAHRHSSSDTCKRGTSRNEVHGKGWGTREIYCTWTPKLCIIILQKECSVPSLSFEIKLHFFRKCFYLWTTLFCKDCVWWG